MVDVKTGHIRREWFNFFTSLFELTGNGQNSVSLTDLQQAPPVIPYGVEGGGGSSAVEGRFYAYLGSTTALATSATNLIVLKGQFEESNDASVHELG